MRRRPGADRVESLCRVVSVAVIGQREEVLRHPGNAQRLVEIARGILRVLSGGQDEAGREAVLVQARERGDRGLPDLPAAPGLGVLGFEDDLKRVGHHAPARLQVAEGLDDQLGIFVRISCMGDVSGRVPAEIDVAEIDEEPLASRRQRSLHGQQLVLDLVVDSLELEAGGVRYLRIGVVIYLLVLMMPPLLVGVLARYLMG